MAFARDLLFGVRLVTLGESLVLAGELLLDVAEPCAMLAQSLAVASPHRRIARGHVPVTPRLGAVPSRPLAKVEGCSAMLFGRLGRGRQLDREIGGAVVLELAECVRHGVAARFLEQILELLLRIDDVGLCLRSLGQDRELFLPMSASIATQPRVRAATLLETSGRPFEPGYGSARARAKSLAELIVRVTVCQTAEGLEKDGTC